MQLSTEKRPSSGKQTVKIWRCWLVLVRGKPNIHSKTKKKQHHRLAFAPCACQRKQLTPSRDQSNQALPVASKQNGARGRKKLLFSTTNWGQSQHMGPRCVTVPDMDTTIMRGCLGWPTQRRKTRQKTRVHPGWVETKTNQPGIEKPSGAYNCAANRENRPSANYCFTRLVHQL